MKKLKKQNEGKFMSRKNSVNTMKNKIDGVAIYFDYKLLGVIGLCILLLARVTG